MSRTTQNPLLNIPEEPKNQLSFFTDYGELRADRKVYDSNLLNVKRKINALLKPKHFGTANLCVTAPYLLAVRSAALLYVSTESVFLIFDSAKQ